MTPPLKKERKRWAFLEYYFQCYFKRNYYRK